MNRVRPLLVSVTMLFLVSVTILFLVSVTILYLYFTMPISFYSYCRNEWRMIVTQF